MRFLAIGECMVELSGAGPDMWRSGFAGDTLNTAWYARARLSNDWDVEYLTRVGVDTLSDRMIGFMTKNNIGTQFTTRDETRLPGLYMITLDEGERSFTYWRNMSAARELANDSTHLNTAIAACDVAYLSGITLAILSVEARKTLIQSIAEATLAGKRTVLDPNLRPALWLDTATMCTTIEEAAKAVHTVLPSYDDEGLYFGDATPTITAQRYLRLGAKEILVKNGGGDMVLAVHGQVQELPAMERVTPVDTTGAGDSFNGGYLAARLTGDDPLEAVRKGHALASVIVSHQGALVPFDKVS